MMVGTDIRLMTGIMNETLLNAEMLEVNQVLSFLQRFCRAACSLLP